MVAPGAEIARAAGPGHVPRHRHVAAYAAIVLRGAYTESGDRGRFRVAAGDVLLHGDFEAHQNAFDRSGAEILNLPLSRPLFGSIGRVADPDRIARIAQADPIEAAAALEQDFLPVDGACADWPDLLAAAIADDKVERIDRWAEIHGLAPATVSRGFRAAYGVSPRRYRLEQRARRAALAIAGSGIRLSYAAADAGFADQAHMTRTIRRLLGATPAGLRRTVK